MESIRLNALKDFFDFEVYGVFCNTYIAQTDLVMTIHFGFIVEVYHYLRGFWQKI